MIKRLLHWLAELSDSAGELCENLSVYPGLGFLNSVGEFVGGFADRYTEYDQKLQWQKQGLEASKMKAQELMEQAVGEKDEKQEGGSGESPTENAEHPKGSVGRPANA